METKPGRGTGQLALRVSRSLLPGGVCVTLPNAS